MRTRCLILGFPNAGRRFGYGGATEMVFETGNGPHQSRFTGGLAVACLAEGLVSVADVS